MFHLPPGTAGLLGGLGLFPLIGLPIYFALGPGPFNLDPGGRPNAFEPFLAKYLRLGEFVVGLATGPIVLLIGSSAIHGQGGTLPWYYASPLHLLGCCVVWGIAFMVWLIYHYEDYQHGTAHTKMAYALSLTRPSLLSTMSLFSPRKINNLRVINSRFGARLPHASAIFVQCLC